MIQGQQRLLIQSLKRILTGTLSKITLSVLKIRPESGEVETMIDGATRPGSCATWGRNESGARQCNGIKKFAMLGSAGYME